MNKLLILFLILPATICFGQEEFFIHNDGLFLGYGQNFNESPKNYSVGFGAFFNRNISIGIALSQYEEQQSLALGLAYFTGKKREDHEIKNYLGISYINIQDINIGGLTVGAYKVFFAGNSFPFSLTMNFTTQMVFQESKWETNYRLVPLFSFVYQQALFEKNIIYPVVGIGTTYNVDDNSFIHSATVGLNFSINFDFEDEPSNK